MSITNRIIRVLKLDVSVFEEIERDPGANRQAALVVAGVALIAGLGSALGAAISPANAVASFLLTAVWTFASWFVWAAIAYWVGAGLFRGVASYAEVLRVTGFAFAPLVLAVIPFVGGLLGAIWTLIALFLAVRQGLDLQDMQAFITVVLGFIVYVIGNILVNGLFDLLLSL